MTSTVSGLLPSYKYIEVKNARQKRIAGYFVRFILAICKEVEPLFTDIEDTPLNIAEVTYAAFCSARENRTHAPRLHRARAMAAIVDQYLQLLGVDYADVFCDDWNNEDTTRTCCTVDFNWPALGALLAKKFGYTLPAQIQKQSH